MSGAVSLNYQTSLLCYCFLTPVNLQAVSIHHTKAGTHTHLGLLYGTGKRGHIQRRSTDGQVNR